jgi:hypothetical protein
LKKKADKRKEPKEINKEMACHAKPCHAIEAKGLAWLGN